MAKFLHTADWHLGIKYTRLGVNAEKAREIRIETAKRLMEVAKKNKVDFIIIAGDIFDNNDVDRKLIDVMTKIIKGVEPISVYILPGNHDPLTRDSLYLDSAWDPIGNVIIIKSKEAIRIPELNVTLYPCPVTQKQTREDLTEGIKATNDHISIGIAHGNLQIEGFVEDPNFPINPRRVEESGLDYLALGEWHSLFMYPGKDHIVRTVYPGTPETTKFGEKNSGKAVIVKIENHGTRPVIQEINSGTLKWEEWEKEVSSINDVKQIEKELTEIEDPEHRIINFYFKGIIDQEVADYLSLFENKYAERFLYFNLIKEDLYLRPSLSRLKAMIPEGTIFGKTIEAIQALMKCQPTLQEYSQISPEEAQGILKEIREIDSAMNTSPETLERALLELYRMAKEVSQ